MAAKPVEWVLVVYYGPEAHRATYGRHVQSNKYTKDYIQLSRKPEFLKALRMLFPDAVGETDSIQLTYRWPTGTAPGAMVFNSADRPHLKWETKLGAPKAWKMALSPSDTTAETIPGDPSLSDFSSAENEFAQLEVRGAGRPYLMAIKLRNQPRNLHLRVYLERPSDKYAWADLGLVPHDIQALAAKTSRRSALAWSFFQSSGAPPGPNVAHALSQLHASKDPASIASALDADTGRALAHYLRHRGYGLFFDPTRNHDAWLQPVPISEQIAASISDLLEARFPPIPQGDAAAEMAEADPDQVDVFRKEIERSRYEVADTIVTTKTRGSAQKAFAEAVKENYGYRCAITGIITKELLVASHIVPWSEDQKIRLDPSNGICLSLLVDRAFETGLLLIEDDFTIRIDWRRVGVDQALRSQLAAYDGQKLRVPPTCAPKAKYLQRRRALVAADWPRLPSL